MLVDRELLRKGRLYKLKQHEHAAYFAQRFKSLSWYIQREIANGRNVRQYIIEFFRLLHYHFKHFSLNGDHAVAKCIASYVQESYPPQHYMRATLIRKYNERKRDYVNAVVKALTATFSINDIARHVYSFL
jgi:hypothetical protein